MIYEEVYSLDYLTRLQTLLRHRVGLWDVVAEAQREGSLDSRIRNHASNDLMALVESLPHLAAVAFNGGTAARLGTRALPGAAGKVESINLPSSSPAYTMPYADKLNAWEALRSWLIEPGPRPRPRRGRRGLATYTPSFASSPYTRCSQTFTRCRSSRPSPVAARSG